MVAAIIPWKNLENPDFYAFLNKYTNMKIPDEPTLRKHYLHSTYLSAALPNTPLPPQPVLTRWGPWLHAALYYADYLGDIQKVVQTFDEEQSVAITEANATISFSSVSADLAYVKSNFGNLPGAITVLEVRDLPLVKAVKKMRGIKENLNQASGSVGTAIVNQFNRVLQRNPGWKVMAMPINPPPGHDMAQLATSLLVTYWSTCPYARLRRFENIVKEEVT
uniref:Uncharacterized protein n=1 Tax=Timema monikensis TaxID=170555 RepID=A0A7R9EDI6_9NEOP|nr:unnamed protein product [Timema monikensis]